MGQYTAPDAYDATRQAKLAAERPDLDILWVLGGYIAVPKGTPVTVAMSLGTLREKLETSGDGSKPRAD